MVQFVPAMICKSGRPQVYPRTTNARDETSRSTVDELKSLSIFLTPVGWFQDRLSSSKFHYSYNARGLPTEDFVAKEYEKQLVIFSFNCTEDVDISADY